MQNNDFETEIINERNENFSANRNFGLCEDAVIGDTNSSKKRSKKMYYAISRKGIAMLVAFCLVFSSLLGFSGMLIANGLSDGSLFAGAEIGTGSGNASLLGDNSRDSSYNATGLNLAAATESKLSIQEIIALAANSVVEIKTEKLATDMWMQQYVTGGAGSGVIISNNGYILTNNHVIDGANKITVTLTNKKSYTATLVGTDSQTDIAVIKIDASGLTSAVFGNSDKLVMGELAVAIGNPLGELGGTATAGIISSLDRQLKIDGKIMTLLQTDASINPGNSGGGLFDQHGQLIGIVVAKSSGSDVEGLGFAIPINQAKEVASQLIDYGYVKGRIDTGLTFVDLTSMQNAMFYGVRNLGIYVKSVDSSNAKSAGFQNGDMIYYVGDKQISSAEDLTNAFHKHKVGDTVKITVVRGERTIDLNLKLGEKSK